MSENAQQRDPDQLGGRSNRGDGEAGPPRRDRGMEPARRGGDTEPDVLLDIPEVSVDSVRLAVDELDADVSLRTRLANLLQLDAGVRVHLKGVELDITGVHAEALLKVRLEKLVEILDRALTTIDRNPQIIEALSRTATASLDDVNRATQRIANLGERAVGPVEQLTGPAAQPPLERAGGATDDLGQQVGAIGAVADRSLREPGGPGQGEVGPGPGPGGPGLGGPGPGGPGPGGVAQGGPGGAREGGPGGEPGGGQAPRGGGLASGSGGGGEQGQAQRAREQAGREAARQPTGAGEEEHAQGAPERGGQHAGGEHGRQPAASGSGGQQPGGAERGTSEAGGEERGGQRPGREEQSVRRPGGERVGGPGGGTAATAGGDRGPGGGREAGRAESSEGPSEGGSGRRPGASGGAQSAAQLAEQAGETLRQAGRSVWEAIQDGVAQHRQQRR
ncbi:hypothetical protein AB0B71_14060 [Micromonospora echinofusca]|uniref:hypothetical protein n=1 Tax=Micromonospora echinofusca TaxID=47858 RepID=UPI0033ED05A3